MTRNNHRKLLLPWVIALLALALVVSTLAEEKPDPATPIKNLQFQSADIHAVLTFLADYGGVNVVVAPEVKGTVTIKLNDINWRTAMNIIGRTYNLSVIDEVEGYIRVLPAEDYRKEMTEQEKHNKEQRELVDLQTKIVKISNSTSDDIVKAVKSLMSARGVANSDARSNSIIIQEVPGNMQKVLDYIADLDKPARQIKISTQILEISAKDVQELGINWSGEGTYETKTGRTFPMNVDVTPGTVSNPAGRFEIQKLKGGWSVDAFVEAIVNSNKGKIVAHPEITTVDNKQAKIQLGSKIPVKQFDEAGNVVIKFEEVGTILIVTPHITAENQIIMYLKPERSSYEEVQFGVVINTSNAETNVIVANGQTAVIGGLTTEDELNSEVGVPILKDIPLIGNLFKYTNKRIETRDLVIFVTPTIVDENLAMGG